ncbi:MAG: hypothetical protein NZL95_03160 [Chitinophagales bacterium]|nr:hypothetical protein [Chitinophagales bacterium]MDW8427530.1 hypothetical protein [Chitinophagales bacterium]
MKYALQLLAIALAGAQTCFSQSLLDAPTAIRELKKGTLLVRLPSAQSRIQALQQVGRHEQAAEVLRQYAEKNQLIVAAFTKHFCFCPFLFFYSDATPLLLQGQRRGFFLNDSLEVDTSLTIHTDFFLIVTIGRPVMYGTDKGRRSGAPPQPGLFGEVFVVHDSQLNQMTAPFPFSAREDFITYLTGGNWEKKVIALNRRLEAYYQMVQQP